MTTDTWKTKEDDEKLVGTLVGPKKDIRILGIAYRDTTTYSYMDFTVFNVKCEKCGREYQISRTNLNKATCRVCGNSTKYNYDKPGYLDDIIGKKFGKLTPIKVDHIEMEQHSDRSNPQKAVYYLCKCDCGNITLVKRTSLTGNKIRSCGCTNRKHNTHVGSLKGKLDDPEYLNEIVGKKFNKLTVIKFDHYEYRKPPKGRNTPRKLAYYLCECECGNTTMVERNVLVACKVKSCGCANYIGVVKHNNSRDRIYSEWRGIKQRCYNPNDPRYSEYGGRGITVCEEWRGKTPEEGFVAFRDWAYANGYSDDLWIDRIDNDGPYSPDNCQWIPPEDQAWNKQQSVRIPYNGKEMNIKEFIEESGSELSARNLQRRFSTGPDALSYISWSFNDKLFIPPQYGRDKYREDHNIKDVFIFEDDSPYNPNKKGDN